MEIKRQAFATRRSMVMMAGVGLVFGGLISRLAYLQLGQGDYYDEKARKNASRIIPIAPERAIIVDRSDTIIANNLKNFRLEFVPKDYLNEGDNNQKLQDIIILAAQKLKLNDNELKSIQRRMETQPDFMPVIIKENLSYDDMQYFLLHKFQFGGFSVKDNVRRFYPYPDATAHVLGYVAKPNENDIKRNFILKIPAIRTGKTGLELYKNNEMLGTPGIEQAEVNVYGKFVRDLGSRPPLRAPTIKTSLHWPAQQALFGGLKNEIAGAGVFCNIHTGEIVAMASAPGFDANIFAERLDEQTWNAMNDDPLNPLTNRAIQGLYPPGSTIKPVVAMAAQHYGLGGAVHQCNGSLWVGDKEFKCWKHEGHGSMNLHDAIKNSCDVWFYQVGLALGFDKIAPFLRQFGLGRRTNYMDETEKNGLVPDSTWKKKTLKEPWYAGENCINTIGQGFMLATPMQLMVMTAAIANGGRIITPHIIDEYYQEPVDLQLKPEFLNVIQDSMKAVVASGTAAGARLPDNDFQMAGKTGTAQVRSLNDATRQKLKHNPQLLEWEQQDHALFVGYAPANAPKFAGAILVEHGGATGGGGSKVAAPIARDVFMQLRSI